MITAFQSGSITILIHSLEIPLSENGKWVFIDGSDKLIKTENKIGDIQLVIPDEEGTGARIIPISIKTIKAIHDAAAAILKEIPAPANVSDYDY